MYSPENWKHVLVFFLNREANINVYLLDEKDEITNPIKTYSDIGPEFKFNLKVSSFFFFHNQVKSKYADVCPKSVNSLFLKMSDDLKLQLYL